MSLPVKRIGTPKPAGEEHNVRRGVKTSLVVYYIKKGAHFRDISISLCYTPRRPADTSPAGYGVPTPFSANTFYPGFTPRAVIFRPFRAHRAFRRIALPPANGNDLIPTTHNQKPFHDSLPPANGSNLIPTTHNLKPFQDSLPPANDSNLIPTTHNLKPTRKPPTHQKQPVCGGKTAFLC